MARLLGPLLALAVMACDPAGPTPFAEPETWADPGEDPEPRGEERVTLHASHPGGVPLHPAERAREMSGRLPDGARVRVLRWGHARRWLEVRSDDGIRGWVSGRYLSGEPAATSAWRSARACRGITRPALRPGRARIASWNLRWFPDGSGDGPGDRATDVGWMACAIAALGSGVVAVQEVMLHARGLAAVQRLLGDLSRITGGRWRQVFDGCPRDGRQHVGFLYDAERVELADVQQLDAVNPRGGCSGHLRPGLSASARIGEQRLRLITVHLDSGTSARDLGNRESSLETLASASGRGAAPGRGSVLVLGDFNTMGAQGTSAERELSRLDARFASAGMRRLRSDTRCTEFSGRRTSRLDLAVASDELAQRSAVQTQGVCAELGCRLPRGPRPAALVRLSDHCPIVVDVRPR